MTIAATDPITAPAADTIVLSADGLRKSRSETVLDVVLPHPPAACRLEITGRPAAATGRELGVEAFVNGWWIGYWRLDGQETVTLLAEIEAEFVRPAPAGSFLKLAWRFTDCPSQPPLAAPGQFEFAAIVIRTDPPAADFDDHANPDVGEDLTDPGICLMCLDEAVPPEIDGEWYTFRLHRPAREVMLWSRSAIPSELGAADDLRRLGIAVSGIEVGGKAVPLNHWSLRDGWQPMEASWRWTKGAARLLLPDGATTVRIQVAATLAQYQPDATAIFSFEEVIAVLLLPGRVVIRLDDDLPADKVRPLVRTGAGQAEALRATQRWTSADPSRQETSLVMAVDLPSLLSAPDLCMQVWIEDYLLWQQDVAPGQTLTGRIEGVRDYCLTGWVANLRGEAVPPLELLLDGEIVADAAITITRHDLNHYVLPPACTGYRIPLPARALDGGVHDIRVRGKDTSFDLVWQARPRFQIGESSDTTVSGWFYDAAMRDEPVTISVCRDGAVLHSTPTTAHGGAMARSGRAHNRFSAAIPPPARASLGSGCVELRAGRDAQLVFASVFPRTPGTAAGALRRVAGQLLQVERMLGLESAWSRDRLTELRSLRDLGQAVRPGLQVAAHFPPGDVSVVVPVYKGVADTRACLDSLAAAVRAGGSGIGEIILVDDCSPEPAMAGLLRDHAERVLFKRLGVTVRVLRNRDNLGFVASVNAGVAAALPNNDILLLNADTIVPVGFASRLQAAAYGRPDIASVSPLSNDATILSLPDRTGGNALGPELMAALNGFLQARGGERVLDIPVGVGFCILLKRAALADVGGFGVEWGRGYCEEVDWCLRARDRGWTHAAAADTFVYHRGSVSFGTDERTRILERNHALLEQRYPDYVGDLKAFMADDPLQALRLDVFCLLLRLAAQPCVVHFTHKMGGGTGKLVESLAERFAAAGGVNLVCGLVTDDWLGEPCYEVWWRERNLTLRLRPAAITDFVLALEQPGQPAAALVVHSLIGVGPDIYAATAATGLPFAVYVHDFQWYCPRVVLVDQTQRYCGEPGTQYCQLCVRANPIYDFGEAEALIRSDLPAWIARNAALLARAHVVVAPSRDTATRMGAHFPLPTLRCVAHPEKSPRGMISRAADADPQTRIAVVGGVNVPKGREVLRALALHVDATGAPVTIKVIGTLDDPGLFADIASISIGGSFRVADLPDLLARFDPHFVFFPGIWPETYSFVLSEVWAAGYPAVAFDVGAIAERIRATGAGMVIPFDTTETHLLPRLLEARGKLARLAGLGFRIGHTGSFAEDPVADLFRAAVRSSPANTASTRTTDGHVPGTGNGRELVSAAETMNGPTTRMSPSASEAVAALLARAGVAVGDDSVGTDTQADEYAEVGVQAADLLAGWELADLSAGIRTSPAK